MQLDEVLGLTTRAVEAVIQPFGSAMREAGHDISDIETLGGGLDARDDTLIMHTAAYWLMLTVRDAIPKPQPLARAEFTTVRARLLKIAARVTETASRVRIAFAAACPEADLFRSIVHSLQPAGP